MNKIQNGLPYFLLSVILVCVLFLLFVPMAERSLEKTVRRKVMETAKGFGLSLNRFQVVGIGLNGAHFRNVEIGKPGEKKLLIPDIHLSYTFNGIRRGEIRSVHLVGLTVHACINRDKTVQISGLPPLSAFLTEKGKEKGTEASGELPPIPDISLDNAFVFLKTPWGSLLIPGNLACRGQGHSLKIRIRLFPEGGVVEGNAKLTRAAMNGTAAVSWKHLPLGQWLSQLAKAKGLSVSGKISGKADLTLTQGKPTVVSVEAALKNTKIGFGGTIIMLTAHGGAHITGGRPEQITVSATIASLISENIKLVAPFSIRLDGKTPDSLRLSTPEIRMLSPIPASLSLSGQLLHLETAPAIRGSYTLRLPAGVRPEGFPAVPVPKTAINVQGKFSGALKNGQPLFTLSAGISQALSVGLPGGNLAIKTAVCNGKISGTPDRIHFSTHFLAKNLTGKKGKASARGEKLAITATGNIRKNAVSLVRARGRFKNFNLDDGSGNKITGLAGEATYAKHGTATGGSFTIDSATTPDISFFHVQSRWKQAKPGFSFSGTAGLPVQPLQLAFTGAIAPNRERDMFLMTFQLPETALSGTDLSPLITSLKGFSATGTVAMSGTVSMAKGEAPVGTAKLSVRDLELAATDESVKITGINSAIRFTNLLNLSSGPSQHATIRDISAGPMKLENGEIRFQLLNQDTVSVEAVSFNFSGGKMQTSPFLISATRPDMDIGIYCHQLALTALLNLAMGGEKTEGNGTVSGYIPINIQNGNMVFGKGFLQSVPGKSGEIRIEDSKSITGGVVLAEEAIKDFTYQWARVNLESQNGNLNLVLQLDGKPNRKLPLIYDDKIGDFVKDPNNQRHVLLQGLKLDLKFVDIDINRLLKQQGKVKFTSK